TELQLREQDLQQAQRIGLMGSWSMELASGKVTWSEQLFAMFGMTPGEAPPSFTEQKKIFSDDSWERLNSAVARTAADGSPYDLELETIARTGIRGWMLARGEALRDSEGRIVGLRGIAQDITQRKQAEQRIAQLTNLYAALNALNKL